MSIFYIAVVLFLLMDPIGNISSLMKLTRDLNPERRKFVILREMGIALATILVFYFLGELIFSVLSISETTLILTLGVILFLVAIKILFPAIDSMRANLPEGEPYIFPLAIPLIAGPAVLATVMLFAHFQDSYLMMVSAIFLAWIASVAVLLIGPKLESLLKTNGLAAAEKLTGLILVMLAIQWILEGVKQFVTSCQ